MAFHARCGECITLSNNNCTAARNISEFNHGLVLSAEPLKDDVLFEVRIDKKVIVHIIHLEQCLFLNNIIYHYLPNSG